MKRTIIICTVLSVQIPRFLKHQLWYSSLSKFFNYAVLSYQFSKDLRQCLTNLGISVQITNMINKHDNITNKKQQQTSTITLHIIFCFGDFVPFTAKKKLFGKFSFKSSKLTSDDLPLVAIYKSSMRHFQAIRNMNIPHLQKNK